MNLDTVIDSLNRKIAQSGVRFESIAPENWSDAEQLFIEKYKPYQVLIVYGTLAPNRPNHSKIAHIEGVWQHGSVRGALVNEGWGAALGYFGFKHTPESAQNIEAFVLFSENLYKNWSYLDQFEGEGYKRIMAKYALDDGTQGIGQIYAINEPNA